MPVKSAQTKSGGFSAAERTAMKERAPELRAEGKKGAKKADGLQAGLDSDRVDGAGGSCAGRAGARHGDLARPRAVAEDWYGMPAYANSNDKVVVFFQDSGKFKYRYSTLGFQDPANLDDGDLWPVAYALQEWSPAVEKRVVELVKAARGASSASYRRTRTYRTGESAAGTRVGDGGPGVVGAELPDSEPSGGHLDRVGVVVSGPMAETVCQVLSR